MLPAGNACKEEQAAAYGWGEMGTGGEYELYGGGDANSGNQASHPLSDAMVMWALACKSAMADPQQIEAWFVESELWLVENVDFPWRPTPSLDSGPGKSC